MYMSDDSPHQHWLGNVNCRTNKIDQEANSADVGHCCHILLCLSSSLQGCLPYHLAAYCSLFDQGFIWFVRRYVAFCLISSINITFGFLDTWSHNLENVQLYCPGFDHMGGHIALRDP